MRLVRVSVFVTAYLLLISGGNAVEGSESLQITESSSPAAAESWLIGTATEEGRFHEADFGPGDPGVTTIANNGGGLISSYESAFFGPESENALWAIDGYCNSACTMVLGTGRVCATPRAEFGFHAGYTRLLFFPFIAPEASNQMYEHYPDDVKAWVNARHALDQIGMTTMRQSEVAKYVPACKGSAPNPVVYARHAPPSESSTGPTGPQVYSLAAQPRTAENAPGVGSSEAQVYSSSTVYAQRARPSESYTGPTAPQVYSPAVQPKAGQYASVGVGSSEAQVYSGPKGRMRWMVGPQPYGM
jgi:hypothetical protein